MVNGKTGKAEKTSTYPDLSDAAKEEFDHLLYRANHSKNPYLKAKFYHMLWHCPSGLKNRKYGELAAWNYAESIGFLHEEIIQKKIDSLLRCIEQDFENLASLCKELKLADIDLESILKNLLEDQANIPFYIKNHLSSVVLKYPSLFNSENIDKCYRVYENYFWELNIRKDPFIIIDNYAPNAIKFAKRLKTDEGKWYSLIGELQLEHVKAEDELRRDWLNLDELMEARINLKRGGNLSLLKEAEKLYEELRPRVNLELHSYTLNREEHEEVFLYRDSRVALANKIVEKADPKYIYTRLMSGEDFPKAKGFDIGNNKLVPEFLKGVRTVFINRNGNTKSGNDELDEKVMRMNFYQIELDFQTIPFLHTLLTKGIDSGKLSAKNFLEYLAHHTWIGTPYFVQKQKNRDHTQNWISLIAPAIIEFFAQVQASGASQSYRPSFVLSIDSLVLKIEGLLRFFLYKSGAKTTVAKPKKVEQMTMNQIIDSEGFEHYFDEDDQLFFEYLFGGEGGLDIRNNIAHCFYDEENYTVIGGVLTIFALLRLAKYNFKGDIKNDDRSEE